MTQGSTWHWDRPFAEARGGPRQHSLHLLRGSLGLVFTGFIVAFLLRAGSVPSALGRRGRGLINETERMPAPKRRGGLPEPDHSKEPKQVLGKELHPLLREGDPWSEVVAVWAWTGVNAEQTQRRKGKLLGGNAGRGASGTAPAPPSLGLCVGVEKRLQMERPRRGRKSQVERERQRR